MGRSCLPKCVVREPLHALPETPDRQVVERREANAFTVDARENGWPANLLVGEQRRQLVRVEPLAVSSKPEQPIAEVPGHGLATEGLAQRLRLRLGIVQADREAM